MKKRDLKVHASKTDVTKSVEKRCRVFISYSRDDLKWVRVIDRVLRRFAVPMWDKDFRYGQGFHEQIQMFIAHAHVFLPVITEQSSKRGWVHQEIGYARALNIPVLPITLGAKALPDAMIQSLQAVRLGDDEKHWAGKLRRLLTRDVLESLVNECADPERAPFQCAEDTEDRARLLAEYSDTVRKLGVHGMVRQVGGLSSFHIPVEPISNPLWWERYGDLHQTNNHCRLLRKERQALEKHARVKGCRLVVNHKLRFERYGLDARIKRLECLLKFLKDMPRGKVQIAFNPDLPGQRSLTIVGNWFAAESVSAAIGQGYRHTIFTRHAPSVQSIIELFDEEFKEALKANNWTARKSCGRAIRELERLIAQLKREKLRMEKVKSRSKLENKKNQ